MSGVYVAWLALRLSVPCFTEPVLKVTASPSASVAVSVTTLALFCVTGTDWFFTTGDRFPGTCTVVVPTTVFGLFGAQSASTGPTPLTSTLAMMWNGINHFTCVPPALAAVVACTNKSGVGCDAPSIGMLPEVVTTMSFPCFAAVAVSGLPPAGCCVDTEVTFSPAGMCQYTWPPL